MQKSVDLDKLVAKVLWHDHLNDDQALLSCKTLPEELAQGSGRKAGATRT
jgi:hypothetical protein